MLILLRYWDQVLTCQVILGLVLLSWRLEHFDSSIKLIVFTIPSCPAESCILHIGGPVVTSIIGKTVYCLSGLVMRHWDNLHIISRPVTSHAPPPALFDTFRLFNQTLNQAQKWFDSIFNSKLNLKYSFNQKFIQKSVQNIQFKILFKKLEKKWFKMPYHKNSISQKFRK